MNSMLIKVNEKYYCGEGDEHITQITPSSNGFHQNTNHGSTGIKFSDDIRDGYVCTGRRAVESHLHRIYARMEPDHVEIMKI